MRPIIIIPPNAISPDDIAELKSNGLCVIVAGNPSIINFIDPTPSALDRRGEENAAIALSRKLLNGQWTGGAGMLTKTDIRSMFVELLIRGTPLDANSSKDEQERTVFDEAKRLELGKIAREEAREEAKERTEARKAKKAATAKKV